MASCTVVAAWALIAAFGLRYSVVHRVRLGDRVLVRPSNPDGTIDDERRGAQMATGRTNPVTVADFPTIGEQARAAARAGRRGITMLIYGGFERSYALRGDFAIPQVWAISGIGIFSYAAGTDVFVDDPLGLASPIGSRLPSEQAARRPGHRKSMSPAWTLARFGGRLRSTAPVSAADVQAARQALECGRLKRLLDGIDQPLTIKRFLENISQAGSNTTFRISRGVRQARRNLCG